MKSTMESIPHPPVITDEHGNKIIDMRTTTTTTTTKTVMALQPAAADVPKGTRSQATNLQQGLFALRDNVDALIRQSEGGAEVPCMQDELQELLRRVTVIEK